MIGKRLLLVLITCFFQSSILPTNTFLRLYHAPNIVVDCIQQTLEGSALDYVFSQPWRKSTPTPLKTDLVAITALHYARAIDFWEDTSTSANFFASCFYPSGSEETCLSEVHRLITVTENQLRKEHQTNHVATNAIMRVGLEIKLLSDAMVRDLYRIRRNGPLFFQALFSNMFILNQFVGAWSYLLRANN